MFPEARDRFRFGRAIPNVETLDAAVLQLRLRRLDDQPTRHDINATKRLRRARLVGRLDVPAKRHITAVSRVELLQSPADPCMDSRRIDVSPYCVTSTRGGT